MRSIARFSSILSLFAFISLLFNEKPARADWVIMPESSNQLYQTYGLYFDEQSTLVTTGGRRAWGALGGTLAFWGNSDPQSESHPQFVFHGTANAAMHYDENFKIFTETVDARVGVAFEFALSPSTRMSIGLTHNSAHAAEGADPSLIEPPLGQEYVPVRVVHDIGNQFRLGATFKPFVRSYPDLLFFAADQFVEYFPWGATDQPQEAAPYIAMGLEQYGVDEIQLTYHAQVGVAFGNHFSKKFHQTLRTVLGFYTGADPRMKYFQFQKATREFGYLGLMFDI